MIDGDYGLLIHSIHWAGKCKANPAYLPNTLYMASSNSNSLLIWGSSRPHGHTYQVVQHLARMLPAQVVDLASLDISYYDYAHANAGDDFLSIAKAMTEADTIILTTPVYWYTMSAQMKTFLDRWSDLLTIRKDLGRALKGKSLALVSCGSSPEEVPGFDMPFRETAGYMEMQYLGHFETWLEDEEDLSQENVQNRFKLLAQSIQSKL